MYTICTCPPEPDTYIWLPTLSDLLHEIEARGYEWKMRKEHIAVGQNLLNPTEHMYSAYRAKESTEDMVAKALDWVLEREGKANV